MTAEMRFATKYQCLLAARGWNPSRLTMLSPDFVRGRFMTHAFDSESHVPRIRGHEKDLSNFLGGLALGRSFSFVMAEALNLFPEAVLTLADLHLLSLGGLGLGHGNSKDSLIVVGFYLIGFHVPR